MKRTLVLGLDLGGTKIAAGVVSRSGKLVSAVRMPTPARGVKRDLRALFDAAQAAVATARVRWKGIRAVGVGVPGAFDTRTETVWAPNLRGWKKVPLRRLLERACRGQKARSLLRRWFEPRERAIGLPARLLKRLAKASVAVSQASSRC